MQITNYQRDVYRNYTGTQEIAEGTLDQDVPRPAM